ncbi:hypothetical protein [Streptosporangium sp. NPDC023615]|uniref:hypothetical protein n=1 Tax=Streptosporangium sp. NPDC023615 TaxID=3154794 RepID=UPI003439C1D2
MGDPSDGQGDGSRGGSRGVGGRAGVSAARAGQAGAYIAHQRLLAAFPLEDYLPAGAYDAYSDSTAKAILLSITAAEDDHPEAAQLLRVLAVLSPAGLPRTDPSGRSAVALSNSSTARP